MKTKKHNGIGHTSEVTFWLMTAVAYLFALTVRHYWVGWAEHYPEFFWHGTLMINTNDGYFWGEGARDILAGFHQPHDLSPVTEPLSKLTAWLVRVAPWSLEEVMLWLPAVMGSLIVIPVMLIARELKQEIMGFVAALLAGIAWSYYNRTMVGYYDTDMLTVVWPSLILWAIVRAHLRKEKWMPLAVALLMLLYWNWYPSAAPLNLAFVLAVLLYTLLFERKTLYHYRLLAFMTIALSSAPVWVLVVALSALGIWFWKQRGFKEHLYALGASLLLFAVWGGLEPVWYQVKGYLLREGAQDGLNLHYFAVTKTVREAGRIPFELFANRISGSVGVFALSVVGYVMLAWRYRVMWLALPMVGLGFLALNGGLRFTVYAVPICALGFGYLAVWIAEYVSAFSGQKRRILFYLLIALFVPTALFPNIEHIKAYKVPTVLNREEVTVLDRLRRLAKREDYVLTWWDYGYPVRFYADVKTLIDGGKHSGDVNFPVSYALSRPQVASANMARLDVEFTERAYAKGEEGDYLGRMMRAYKAQDPDRFLARLQDKISLPAKTRDVYYYLPLRMLDIFPTVCAFSNIDLHTGQMRRQPFFIVSDRFKDTPQKLYLGGGIVLNKKNGRIALGQKEIPLTSITTVTLDKAGRPRAQTQKLHDGAPLYLIFMRSYGRILLMDRQMFDSAYIQLFVLGRYDPALFEPVIFSPYAAVYKLKR